MFLCTLGLWAGVGGMSNLGQWWVDRGPPWAQSVVVPAGEEDKRISVKDTIPKRATKYLREHQQVSKLQGHKKIQERGSFERGGGAD